MDSEMNDFDIDKPLPSVIAIKCAQNHLYNTRSSKERVKYM